MTIPAHTQTWIYSKNNNIPYVSTLDTTQNLLYGLKEFLKANGYTVKFSSAGGVGPTGPTDTTDRWTSAAAITPATNSTTAPHAWLVLEDAAGIEILFDLVQSTGDQMRIEFSYNGFSLAGTTTHSPTASDTGVVLAGLSTIGGNVTGDRKWHAWVTSDAKLFRFAVARAGAFVAFCSIGKLIPTTADGVSITPLCHGIHMGSIQLTFATWTQNTSPVRVAGGIGTAYFGSSVPFHVYQDIGNIKPEAQGSSGHLVGPIYIWGRGVVGTRGRWGSMPDFWLGRSNAGADDGDTYDGGLDYVQMGDFILPWDGSPIPLLT